MSDTANNLDKEVRIWQEKLFERSIRRRRKADRLKKLVGGTLNLQCLEVSAGDGTISSQLRQLGGSWRTAVSTKAAADSISYSLSETITLVENGKLPFEDNTFDRLVIVDALKCFSDDYEFLHECHRVIKNDGWLVISENRRVPVGLVAFCQRMCGALPVSKGARRNGYKVQELFDKLRDGYDVPETILYSNSLFEAAVTLGEGFQKMVMRDPYWLVREKVGQDELYRYRRLYGMSGFAYPLLWLLSKLEFLPGQKILVKSRRRHWRPRLQPKLIDGRSIAEAAINTKIGTAAPF